MRKIKIESNQSQLDETRRAIRFTLALNANLLQQAENLVRSQWSQQDYTYSSLSDLIKKSLQAYQQRKIKLKLELRDKKATKREITIRWSGDLLNFYHSLPIGQRTAIIEGSLQVYLEKLGS